MSLVVLIGASGSGKTTIAHLIEDGYADGIEVFYFDRIGVPSAEQMITEYGSCEGWQHAKTIEWMAKLAQLSQSRHRVLFEGQTRLAFLSLQREPLPPAVWLTCQSLWTATMIPGQGVCRSEGSSLNSRMRS